MIDPPDGRVPLRPEAEAAARCIRRQESDDYNVISPWDRCITRGVPGGSFPAGYNNAYQIVQTPGYVVIHYEMIHMARIIPTDGRAALPATVRLWDGDPSATGKATRWSSTSPTTTARGGSRPTRRPAASRAFRRAKRCTSSSDSRGPVPTIDYQVTIDDPKVYTRPWTVQIPLNRDDDYQIYEYACHEGNHAIEHMLRGGRARDREAAVSAHAAVARHADIARWIWSVSLHSCILHRARCPKLEFGLLVRARSMKFVSG